MLNIRIALSLCCLCAVSLCYPRELSFGVVPQQSASRLAELWIPILNEVSLRSGTTITFATAPSINEFEKQLQAGKYDLSYMNPYHYTVYSQHPGYNAFAKEKGKSIKGILVVHKNSPIKSLEQLNNTNLAFPSPAAFAATILPQSQLKQQHIAFKPRYVQSHDSVYLAVANQAFVGGGGIMRTFNSMPQQVRDQLTVLYTTPPYTPHAFAAHARVPEPTVARIQQAFISLMDDENAYALLQKLAMSGFEPAEDSDWDDIRALNITLIENNTQVSE